MASAASMVPQDRKSNVRNREATAKYFIFLALPGVLFLTAFLLVPAVQLLVLGFVDGKTGAFTLDQFRHALNSGAYFRVLNTTLIIAFQATVLCILFATPLAYWLVGLPERRQRLLTVLILMAFWTSSLVKNFMWLILFGRNGPLSKLLVALGGEPLSILFGRSVVIFGMMHTMLPLAVVVMLPVMMRVDKRLPLAAQTLGANSVKATWLVFMPLALPGVFAATLLVFIGSLGFFITPALLGSPRETMIGQSIILQIKQFNNSNLAAALSGMLLLATIVICIVYDRVFGLSNLAGSGSSGNKAQTDRLTRRIGHAIIGVIATFFGAISDWLGRRFGENRFGWLLSVYGWSMVVVLLLPVLLFIPMAFTDSTFLSFPPPAYSLRWFQEYFGSVLWVNATVRSFLIGLVVATVTMLIATAAAYGVARANSKLSPFIYMFFLLPMILPPIVIAVSIFYLFSSLSLIGSNVGIIIGHIILALPVTFVIVAASLNNFDWRVEQAAETLGAGFGRRMWHITLPLMKGGILASFIFAFLVSFEELTVAIFIGGGLKTTLPKQMWDSILLNVEPTLAAASVVVIVAAATLFLLAEFLRPKVSAKG